MDDIIDDRGNLGTEIHSATGLLTSQTLFADQMELNFCCQMKWLLRLIYSFVSAKSKDEGNKEVLRKTQQLKQWKLVFTAKKSRRLWFLS